MNEEQTAAECLDDLSTDTGFRMFAEITGERLHVSPTALVPFMLAMALEVGVVMMSEQLERIDAALKEGNPMKLAIVIATSHETLDHFTKLAMEAGARIGLDRTGAAWPEVLEDEPVN